MKPLKAPFIIAVSFFMLTGMYAQNASIACPPNMIVKTDSGKEGAVVHFPALPPELSGAIYNPVSGSFFRLGPHSIMVTTPAGQKCSFTVLVTDNEAPSLSPLALSRDRLWPASNKMKKVAVHYEATDNSGTVRTTIAVKSNAADGVKDWEQVDDHLLRLKASRLPEDTPRIYTITVTATDDAGNKTTRTTTIAVSRTMTAVAAK